MRYHSTLESNHSNIGEKKLSQSAMLIERNHTNTVDTIYSKRSQENCK